MMEGRRWGDAEIAEHPAPEVPCRIARDEEIGRSARSLVRLAESHGWRVVVTYARGATLKTLRIVDSIAVRLSRPGHRAVAMWLDGTYSGMDIVGFRSLSWQEMRDVVASYPELRSDATSPKNGRTDIIMPKVVEQAPESVLTLAGTPRRRVAIDWSQYVDGVGREFAGPKEGRDPSEIDFEGKANTVRENVRRWAEAHGVTEGELKPNHAENTIYVRLVMPEGGLKDPSAPAPAPAAQSETNPYA